MNEINFAEALKKIRKKLRLTQRLMAGHLGISYGAYLKLEQGRKIPRLDKLEKYAEILHLSIPELLGQEDERGERIAEIKAIAKDLGEKIEALD